MFVTTEEVRNLGFISYLDPNLNLDYLITEAITNYIIPVLTEPLYEAIILNPNNYIILTDIYLRPCLCFYTKYHYYNQLFNENFYGTNGLSDLSLTHPLLVEARLKLLIATFKFAKAYEAAMIEYIISQNFEEYIAPDPPANPDPYPDVVPDPDPDPDPDPVPDPDPDPEPDPSPTETHKLVCGFYI